MWETAFFGAGFLFVAAGVLSLIYPLRWVGIIYWRLIHPGCDIIRRMWLRAIAHRAESATATAR